MTVTNRQWERMMEVRRIIMDAIRNLLPLDHDNYELAEWAYHADIAERANAAAAQMDLPNRVSIGQVRALEAQALGHSDYAAKFALYVAEAVAYPTTEAK